MDDGPTRPGRRHRVGPHSVALGAAGALTGVIALHFRKYRRHHVPTRDGLELAQHLMQQDTFRAFII